MPDHFHFLLKPNELGCQQSPSGRYRRKDEEPTEKAVYQQNLSHGLKVLLSSYTRALYKEVGRRGSLFKAGTEAKPGYENFYPDASALDAEKPFTLFIPYLKICFFYIHDNPTKANLVTDPLEWEHSSALDYAGYRDSGICNFALTEQLLGISRQPSVGDSSDRLVVGPLKSSDQFSKDD
ncbi:putative transposase [Lewinella marina]|nr:hypothetical protein [Neolewinella marina]NJB84881.1 putative transposase [Neolewinella marina]